MTHVPRRHHRSIAVVTTAERTAPPTSVTAAAARRSTAPRPRAAPLNLVQIIGAASPGQQRSSSAASTRASVSPRTARSAQVPGGATSARSASRRRTARAAPWLHDAGRSRSTASRGQRSRRDVGISRLRFTEATSVKFSRVSATFVVNSDSSISRRAERGDRRDDHSDDAKRHRHELRRLQRHPAQLPKGFVSGLQVSGPVRRHHRRSFPLEV